jgi:hypothetical protein
MRSEVERENTEVLLRVYLTIQQLVEDLYTQADNAASSRNYNDASVLTGQAEVLYRVAENLETVISEHEE